MKALLDAIKTKFSATASLGTAFPGGYWRDLAAKGTPMPYVVSTVVAAPTETKFGGVAFDDTTIRFTAYGVGHDAVLTAIETFVGVFDEVALTLAGATELNVTRRSSPVPRIEGPLDASGNKVWRADVVYDFAIQ